MQSRIYSQILSIVFGTMLIGGAVIAEDLPKNSMKLILGEEEYVSEIQACQTMRGMTLVAGETRIGQDKIHIRFQHAMGKRQVIFERTFTQDGVMQRESWEADTESVTNSVDGRIVTAQGTLRRIAQLISEKGTWTSKDDTVVDELEFSLIAVCQ